MLESRSQSASTISRGRANDTVRPAVCSKMSANKWNVLAVVAFSVGAAILSMSSAFPQTTPSKINPLEAENPAFRSPEGRHAFSPPAAFDVKLCLTDSDGDRGFECFGPRPETGETGSCLNGGPGGPPKAIHYPLTPHPTCLVDAECDPGRKCFGNDPAHQRRGDCLASNDAPRAEATTPNPK